MSHRRSSHRRRPDLECEGAIEVGSTPTGVMLRITADNGEVIETAPAGPEQTIRLAATLMFCALRHVDDPDEAVESFVQEMQRRSAETSAKAAIYADPRNKPS